MDVRNASVGIAQRKENRSMGIVRRVGRTVAIMVVACVGSWAMAAAPAAASAPSGAWWAIASEQTPTYLPEGGVGKVVASVTDVGAVGVNATHTPVTVTDTLPSNLEPTGVTWSVGFGQPGFHSQWEVADLDLAPCATSGQEVTCTFEPFYYFGLQYLPVAVLQPSSRIEIEIGVKVAPEPSFPGEVNRVQVAGGEPLACREVGPEEGGFVDSECHGAYPFRSEFVPSPVSHRDFEQVASGEAVPPAELARPLVVSNDAVDFGVDDYSVTAEGFGGGMEARAGSHPFQYTTSFVLNQRVERTRGTGSGEVNAEVPAPVKNTRFDLPPGFIGNPTATPRCSAAQFLSNPSGSVLPINECPASSAVGMVSVTFDDPALYGLVSVPVPLFNLEPTAREPARFGFFALGLVPVVLDTSLRTGGDYGVTVIAHRIPEISAVLATRVTFWGVPGDARHDAQRGWSCGVGGFYALGTALPSCAASQAPSADPKPFLRLPTACRRDFSSPMFLQSWLPGALYLRPVEPDQRLSTVRCSQVPFDTGIQVDPAVRSADSPSGLDVDLHVPQEASEVANGLAEADLKDAVVSLPPGVAVNPSSANGLSACTSEQIELNGPDPARCPDASKIGSVEVDTPLLEHSLTGGVYVAAPRDNPFGSLLAIYVAADDPQSGVVIKLAGHVEADPQTGQLITTFDENPQLPFEDFKLDFFGGPGASLMTPATCGEYTTTTDMRPWSENGDKHPSASFSIDSGPNGGPCANTTSALPNRQGFTAGTINPVAGDQTPFVLNVSREDGTQRLSRIDTVLPPGLVGKLAGIPYCPEAALAAAARKKGAAELAAPSCPAASRVGSVRVGAGAGPQPYFVSGTAYLAGPYKGAPISLAVVTPAVAGPFDLGTVVVRVALHVDPETAQISAVSDPLPQILEGIPLDVRSIRLQTDITRNPTSCEPMSVDGTAFSTLGEASPLSDRFQVGSCAELGFKPRLFTRLFGRTRRGGNPRLRTVLTMPSSGQANIARAAVTLPHSEFLDQAHIGTVCTRVQYAAHACPPDSIYGYAKAWSPLLDQPLEGPVYLRSSSHELPDLVASLDGQIHIDLDGRIDSVHGGIRTIFAAVPDAPVSKFMLSMKGGKKGLLENSTDICAKVHRTVARFSGHNGARSTSKPKLKASCGSRRKHTRHGRRP